MNKTASSRTFIFLILIYAAMTAVSVFMPQNIAGGSTPAAQMPAPLYMIAIASAGLVTLVYGGLGFVGLLLSRKLGLPVIWDSRATNSQRFLIPGLIGLGIGSVLIIGDQIFAQFNGIGFFPHPAFPTSIIASIAAGVGEETLFRLFFISFWTWLVSRIILRGRWQTQIYWVFSCISAVLFGLSHLPSVMFLFGWTSMSQVPPALLVELILLNGILALFAAYYFKKFGFLAAVGVHLWADILWHVIWGLV